MVKKSRKQRRAENQKKLHQMKVYIAGFCNFDRRWSTLELVVVASEKLDLVVRGNVHPNSQIMPIYKKIKQSEQNPKIDHPSTDWL
ncbi:hypothetical protein [Vibrio sp.]|uniref:hypothetical protein n=1 Tax=Vibrio sp. TaxID=678 RepID=UPI00257BEA24|nr:hypothetical protein [Vibrio sp.]